MAIEALVRRNVKLILYAFVLSTLALLLIYGAWTAIVSTEVIRINLDATARGNKMAVKHVSHICRVSGNVSLPNGGFGPGGLSLWQCDETKEYQIQVERMEGPAIMFDYLLETTMKVTEDTVTFSDDEVRRERTIQLRDADPNELQFFIDKIPAPIKEKMQESRTSELERQLRDFQQREEDFHRQLREMQQSKENLQRQLTESQRREENSQRQLREMQRQLSELRQRRKFTKAVRGDKRAVGKSPRKRF